MAGLKYFIASFLAFLIQYVSSERTLVHLEFYSAGNSREQRALHLTSVKNNSMNFSKKHISTYTISLLFCAASFGQKTAMVNVVKDVKQKKVDVFMGNQLFTSFIYPDSLEKPVLYPVIAADGAVVTRGYPIAPRANEPTDHPHHVGVWFTFENVNGLDFWNNSFAIPAEKKGAYGWIKTDSILETKSGEEGLLTYHANWTNQKNDVLLEETTSFEFSGGKGW